MPLYRLFDPELKVIGHADNLKPTPQLLGDLFQGTQGAALVSVAADDEAASPRKAGKIKCHQMSGDDHAL